MFKLSTKIILSLLAILLFTGCEEYEIDTTINSDESISRKISVEYYKSSKKRKRKSFSIVADSISTTELPNNKIKDVIGKKYKSAKELNIDFDKEHNRNFPRIKAELNKKFNWLFTDYKFAETYQPFFPFNRIPFAKHFSVTEAEFINKYIFNDLDKELEKTENSLLKKKFDEWIKRSVFEELYYAILPVSNDKYRLENEKEKVYTRVHDKLDINNRALNNELITSIIEGFNTEEIQLIDAEKLYKTDAFKIVRDKYEKMENIAVMGIKNRISVPGIIADTNAQSIAGSTAYWEVEPEKFFFTDYKMSISYRIINWWFVITTALLILVALTFLFLKKR